MATDFFERQTSARKTTAWLIGMFSLAVVALVVATTGIAYLLTIAQMESGVSALNGGGFPWQVPAGVAGGTLALIGGGSLFKTTALRLSGGHGVAESLGGRRLASDAKDAAERRLLNVVEEMAIASGTPVPPVFLLEEKGVNAFAAGYSPSDAVIGVTRGCVESLTRDELQGVVAHEFSHILNGDMRMSIRLIGVLHGILLLGLIGQIVLRSFFYSGTHIDSRRSGSDDSGKGGAAILVIIAIAVALVVLGSVGSFIGGMIKAAVSRQREYLADASAVQFTRNPGGIAGALKRIAATVGAGRISHPRASEMSHMYFSQGVWEGFTSLMATHPPLGKRILALEPGWDGSLPAPLQAATGSNDSRVAGLVGDVTTARAPTGSHINEKALGVVENAVHQVGEPEERHRRYAAKVLAAIPADLAAAAREPHGAQAVVYALLIDRDRSIRQKQYDDLRDLAAGGVLDSMLKLLPTADQIDARLRLPLVDLTLPALGAMSQPQYQRFSRSSRALILADERIGLFEWTLSQVLMRHLRPKFEPVRSPWVKHRSLRPISHECSVVLSTLARAGAESDDPAAAFNEARAKLSGLPLTFVEADGCGLGTMREALAEIAQATAAIRGRVVDAAAAAICADDRVTVVEAELLRGISDLLDCPMPPLLAGQDLSE